MHGNTAWILFLNFLCNVLCKFNIVVPVFPLAHGSRRRISVIEMEGEQQFFEIRYRLRIWNIIHSMYRSGDRAGLGVERNLRQPETDLLKAE
jgi:hypothetical protein